MERTGRPEGGDFVSVRQIIPEAELDIRYFGEDNFLGRRVDGYEEPLAILTRRAALALREVSGRLRAAGYGILIYDAYRPQSAVDHFVRWARDREDRAMQARYYPEVDKGELFDRGYIAARSGHSRGSTVDLTLTEGVGGQPLDMGSGFDHFGEISHSDCLLGLTEAQRANRRLLREAMTEGGFVPIRSEWWHFTLADEPYPDRYFTFPVSTRSLEGEGALL